MKYGMLNFFMKGHYSVGIALLILLGFSVLGIQKILSANSDSGWWGVSSASLLAGAILISYIPLYRLFYYLANKFWPTNPNNFIERLLRKLLAWAIIAKGLSFAVVLIILFSRFN